MVLFTLELVFAYCPSRREGVSQKARLPEGAPWSFGKYQENDRALKEVPDTVPGVVTPSNVARLIGLRVY